MKFLLQQDVLREGEEMQHLWLELAVMIAKIGSRIIKLLLLQLLSKEAQDFAELAGIEFVLSATKLDLHICLVFLSLILDKLLIYVDIDGLVDMKLICGTSYPGMSHRRRKGSKVDNMFALLLPP